MNNPLSPTPKAAYHPMMIIAALAVILFCLAGTAALMGWIPSSIGGNRSDRELSEADRRVLAARLQDGATAQPSTQAFPARQQAYAPVQQPARPPVQQYAQNSAQSYAAPVQQYSDEALDNRAAPRATQREPVQLAEAKPAKNWCNNCGNVVSVRTITTRAQGSGVGAAGGAVLGGLLGNQIGSGHGRQLATVAGAVGGAVVGNQVEGNMKATHSYEIRVRLDNGSTRTFHQQSAPGWHEGDRVKVVNGGLRAVQ